MKKNRIAREKETVEPDDTPLLSEKEKNTVLCPDCEELLRYAHARLDRCPFGEKRVRARNVPYTATNLSCVNGCGKPCASPDRE